MTTITVSSNYVVLLTDEVILVDSSGGPITITMPPVHITGMRITLKDKAGTSEAFPITVVSADGDLIDDMASFSIDNNYQAVTLHSTGSNWAVF